MTRNSVAFFALALAVAAAPVFARGLAEEGSFDRTLKVNGPVELRVSTGSGTIKVSRGSGSEVHISARIKANEWGSFWSTSSTDQIKEIERNPPVRQEGNRIIIGDEHGRRFEHITISYEITTPQETRLNATSGSGGVEAFDVHGPADLGTGSGTITGAHRRGGSRADRQRRNHDFARRWLRAF